MFTLNEPSRSHSMSSFLSAAEIVASQRHNVQSDFQEDGRKHKDGWAGVGGS